MKIIKDYLKAIHCEYNENNPKFIVIHETDNTSKGAGALKHGQAHKNGNLGTSVHFYVDDTYIVQTLDFKDGAWAVGKNYNNGKTPPVAGVNNNNSINIEICVNPDSNYEKARLLTVELTKYLMKELGIPASRVIRHYDAKWKRCPSKMMDNPALWDDFKKRLTQKEVEYDMKRIVIYKGDIDAAGALLLSQNLECGMMKEEHYLKEKPKVEEVISVCGKDRYETFKKYAELLK